MSNNLVASDDSIIRAIILAGGEGTRLRPMTDHFPKPLARVANKPMLEHIIYGLRQSGIAQIALATGYKANAIEEYFGDGARCDVHLQYVLEPFPLGSGGAIANVCTQINEYSQNTFVVASADVLHNADMNAALKLHRERGALITIVCSEVANPQDVGICEIESDGRIAAFYEKPAPGITDSRWANIALWIFEPQVLKEIPTGKFTRVEDELFVHLLREGAPLYAYRHEGYWLDVGTAPRYLQAQRDALGQRFPHHAHGSLINEYSVKAKSGNPRACEPSLLGNDCAIAKTALLRSCVLGDGVQIGEGAILENCMIYDGAVIGAEAELKRAVVGPNVVVPDGAHLEDVMSF